MKGIVLLNCGAGTICRADIAEQSRLISTALERAGINSEIRNVNGSQLLTEAVSAAALPVDVVIAAGGDGTLSTVASALATEEKPMGILPLGTLNHFAKDLGIPLDLESAAHVISGGNIASIDVAEVNGRVFINNSSIGAYPRLVLERETYRSRHGWSKWTAMSMAVLSLCRRCPMIEVRLETNEGVISQKSPFVFVGNNRYDLALLNVGTRREMNRGELSLYIANVQSRWGMFMLILRACFGTLEQARDFQSFLLSSCDIHSRRHRLHVAIDGEVVKLSPPLEYRIRAGVLRVFVPGSAGGKFVSAQKVREIR